MGRSEREQSEQRARSSDKLSVWELLHRGAAEYVKTHRGGQASPQVQNVLAKLSLCRSDALGGRWYQCEDCCEITKLHNSCGDRHCPQCSGSKRRDWNDRAEKLLIDGVEYYQVVFTLPKDLSTLALGNRMVMADLLFQSAWKALHQSIRDEQGYHCGALMVLHTWNQKLDNHWHVHALVPAAGPSLSDETWQTASAPPTDRDPQSERKYLVDAINLRRNFRKFALRHLQRLYRAEKLSFGGSLAHLQTDQAWQTFTAELTSIEWASHIQPPRNKSSRPEHVVRYLTRYLTGGPISDYRITEADEQTVTIMARAGEKTGGQSQQVPYTMKTAEFVRRWCLHIQPDQLTKTRQFGGWSNTQKHDYLNTCRAALKVAGLSSEPIVLNREDRPEEADNPSEQPLKCDHCGSAALRLLQEFPKPSWRTVFKRNSTLIPSWYADSLAAEDRQFWDGVMGAGFSDFYAEHLKTQVEVAKVTDANPGHPQPPLLTQRLLPGINLTSDYYSETF